MVKLFRIVRVKVRVNARFSVRLLVRDKAEAKGWSLETADDIRGKGSGVWMVSVDATVSVRVKARVRTMITVNVNARVTRSN